MFGKSKSSVTVEESVNAIMKYAAGDEMFAALLQGVMAGNAVRMKAMVKTWADELKKKGADAGMIAAVNALQDMDVAKKVRDLVLKK